MAPPQDETERLLGQIREGDLLAQEVLLQRYVDRLKRAVAFRMDPRLCKRLGASDIVQEALIDASRKLPEYTNSRPLPFYPWLRRLAMERLAQAHRYHLRSSVRTLRQEEPDHLPIPDESAILLAERLISIEGTPEAAVLREENRLLLLEGFGQLSNLDQEILAVRYWEGLPFDEIGQLLGVRLSAVKMRHLRAIQRLRNLIKDEVGSDAS